MEPRSEYLPMDRIREPSHRLRESIDVAQLGELADSMAAEGLHQPIGVRGPDAEGYDEIVWGHRRYLAAALLHWTQIEGKRFPLAYDPLLAAVSENLQRADLTPMEEARAVARFVERGEPDAAIARLFRRSIGWVHQRRALLDLPQDLQDAIQAATLTMSVALALRDIDHTQYRAELIAEAIRTGATAGTAEVWRAHYLADRERLVSNLLTVQEIASRREAWKILVPCDACGTDQDYQRTESWRLCAGCARDLRQALREATAAVISPAK